MNGSEIKALAKVEADMETQKHEMEAQRKRMHELSNNIAALQATLTAFEKRSEEVHREFLSHMEREEAAFEKLYVRLRNMDNSIVEAFKERDHRIAQVDKATVKIVAYATGAFTIAMIVLQTVMRHFT